MEKLLSEKLFNDIFPSEYAIENIDNSLYNNIFPLEDETIRKEIIIETSLSKTIGEEKFSQRSILKIINI